MIFQPLFNTAESAKNGVKNYFFFKNFAKILFPLCFSQKISQVAKVQQFPAFKARARARASTFFLLLFFLNFLNFA